MSPEKSHSSPEFPDVTRPASAGETVSNALRKVLEPIGG